MSNIRVKYCKYHDEHFVESIENSVGEVQFVLFKCARCRRASETYEQFLERLRRMYVVQYPNSACYAIDRGVAMSPGARMQFHEWKRSNGYPL
jgi:hypothetical protein